MKKLTAASNQVPDLLLSPVPGKNHFGWGWGGLLASDHTRITFFTLMLHNLLLLECGLTGTLFLNSKLLNRKNPQYLKRKITWVRLGSTSFNCLSVASFAWWGKT